MIIAMGLSANQAEYDLSMPVSDWLFIDAAVDNHIHAAIHGYLDEDTDEADHEEAGPEEGNCDDDDLELEEDGLIPEPPVATLGAAVRDAGQAQVAGWPADAEGFATWPAPGQTATVTLTGEQWDLVLSALRRSAGDEDVVRSRDIGTAVRSRLTERGWSPAA